MLLGGVDGLGCQVDRLGILGHGQEVVAIAEQWAKELQANVDQLRAEFDSSEHRCKDLEQEVNTTHISLQGAWDVRARLEEDVLSLTEATVLLEAELKIRRR
ncbi:hypothetical protein BHE74_00042824 [Ensete ventricosum]|nr:hypothetical protein BHE74_00042824 [Ensete ventricosum]